MEYTGTNNSLKKQALNASSNPVLLNENLKLMKPIELNVSQNLSGQSKMKSELSIEQLMKVLEKSESTLSKKLLRMLTLETETEKEDFTKINLLVTVRLGITDEAKNYRLFNKIAEDNPSVSLTYDDAGPGQSYIKMVGPNDIINSITEEIKNSEPDQDSRWFYLTDSGDFEEYPKETSKSIEKSFKKGDPEINFTGSNNIKYKIIFGENGFPHKQHRNSNGIVNRTVRRGSKACQLKFGANHIKKWYWADENKSWKLYNPEVCKLINDHYNVFYFRHEYYGISHIEDKKSLSRSEAVLVRGDSGYAYYIDFVNMVQYNKLTGKWRSIRREEMNNAVHRISVNSESVPWIPHPELI